MRLSAHSGRFSATWGTRPVELTPQSRIGSARAPQARCGTEPVSLGYFFAGAAGVAGAFVAAVVAEAFLTAFLAAGCVILWAE